MVLPLRLLAGPPSIDELAVGLSVSSAPAETQRPMEKTHGIFVEDFGGFRRPRNEPLGFSGKSGMVVDVELGTTCKAKEWIPRRPLVRLAQRPRQARALPPTAQSQPLASTKEG